MNGSMMDEWINDGWMNNRTILIDNGQADICIPQKEKKYKMFMYLNKHTYYLFS